VVQYRLYTISLTLKIDELDRKKEKRSRCSIKFVLCDNKKKIRVLIVNKVWDSSSNGTVYLNQLSNALTVDDLQPIGTPRVQSLSIGGKDMLISQVYILFLFL
jgi:hypothetical protein